jgi:hypothetical protein
MTYIHPLANALPQSFATQHELSAEKTRQMRAVPIPPRGVATSQADQFEHQIESSEEAAPVHEEARQKRQSRGRRQRHHEDEPRDEQAEPEHIDVKA